MKARFCYEIDARTEMGINHETGGFEPIYMQKYMRYADEELLDLPKEEYDDLHQNVHRNDIAEMIDCPEEYVKPISIEEFEAATQEAC